MGDFGTTGYRAEKAAQRRYGINSNSDAAWEYREKVQEELRSSNYTYDKQHFELDSEVIGNAVHLIATGKSNEVEISSEVRVYKVSTDNPKKYTIRIDICQECEDNG